GQHRRHRRDRSRARLHQLDLADGASAAQGSRRGHGERAYAGRRRAARCPVGTLRAARNGLTRRGRPFDNAATMDVDLAALEERVEMLIAYARELRATNELLRRELLAAQERNRDLGARVAQASARLDALI